jgi:hypothetical protein
MLIPGENGVFFINLDPWGVPVEDKEWFKFSIDPFDIDFLKFHRIQEGCFNQENTDYKDVAKMLEYLGVCGKSVSSRNAFILFHTFYVNDTMKNVLNYINKLDYKNKDVSYQMFHRIKLKYKNSIKLWLERLFREYNEFDNSLEYIQDYYNNWVRLVSFIQQFTGTAKRHILWRFMDRYKIKSFDQFISLWKSEVLDNKIHLKGLSKEDKEEITKLILEDRINVALTLADTILDQIEKKAEE